MTKFPAPSIGSIRAGSSRSWSSRTAAYLYVVPAVLIAPGLSLAVIYVGLARYAKFAD